MQRNVSLDLLKLVLSLFVVGLHLHFFDDVDGRIGFFLNQGLFRLAVPLFLVINGYFFARIDTFVQYKKWLFRILFLYTFWMLIYSPFWFTKNIYSNIINLLKGYFHLWYIIGIAYCSVLIYFLRNQNRNIIIFLSLFLYAVGIVLQYANAYDYINVPNFTYRNFLFFCLPFFSIGFIIKKCEIVNNPLNIDKYLIISVAFFFAEVIFNIFNLSRHASFDINASFIFLCPLLFYKVSKTYVTLSMQHLALLASVIYFVHPLVFKIIQHFLHLESMLIYFITITITGLFSFPLIKLNQRIKIL